MSVPYTRFGQCASRAVRHAVGTTAEVNIAICYVNGPWSKTPSCGIGQQDFAGLANFVESSEYPKEEDCGDWVECVAQEKCGDLAKRQLGKEP